MILSAGFWLVRVPFRSKDNTLLKPRGELMVIAVSAEVSEAVEHVEDAEETGSDMGNNEVFILRAMINGQQ